VGVTELLAEVVFDGTVTDAAADGAGVELEDTGVAVSALIAFCCAEKVVEEMGQPTPGPSRFCSVTAAAFKRAL